MTVQFRPYEEMVSALFKPMNSAQEYFLHGAVGLAGESIEFFLATATQDEENLKEELGDWRFYLQTVLTAQGWTFAGLAEHADQIQIEPEDYNFDQIDCVKGFIIESGNIMDLAKKGWVYNRELDVTKLCNHVTLACMAYSVILEQLEWTDEEICHTNQLKLCTGPKARYPQGVYTDEDANARADKVDEGIGGA